MRVMVTGSRDWEDTEVIHRELSRLQPTFIIEGGAPGADDLCAKWGALNGIPVATVKANWKVYGKSAGPIRNGWMLELSPEIVIGFPLPHSRGTWDALTQAAKSGIETIVVRDYLEEPKV